MAECLKCDSCGKITMNPKEYLHIRAYKHNSATSYNGNYAVKHQDVCPDCFKKIFKEEK